VVKLVCRRVNEVRGTGLACKRPFRSTVVRIYCERADISRFDPLERIVHFNEWRWESGFKGVWITLARG